jgi:hypothetical protein
MRKDDSGARETRKGTHQAWWEPKIEAPVSKLLSLSQVPAFF